MARDQAPTLQQERCPLGSIRDRERKNLRSSRKVGRALMGNDHPLRKEKVKSEMVRHPSGLYRQDKLEGGYHANRRTRSS
jgi:hypothetical protein